MKKSVLLLVLLLVIQLCGCSLVPVGTRTSDIETLKNWSFQHNEGTNDYSVFFALFGIVLFEVIFMMKSAIAILMAIMLCMTLIACGNQPVTQPTLESGETVISELVRWSMGICQRQQRI